MYKPFNNKPPTNFTTDHVFYNIYMCVCLCIVRVCIPPVFLSLSYVNVYVCMYRV